MTNVYKPRHSVNINTGEQVTHPNGSGWVSRPSWEPSEGKRRQEQIEEARQQAIQEYESNLADQHPHAQRLCALEAKVTSLTEKLEYLNKQFVDVLTNGK
jgi:hypothetical protein